MGCCKHSLGLICIFTMFICVFAIVINVFMLRLFIAVVIHMFVVLLCKSLDCFIVLNLHSSGYDG